MRIAKRDSLMYEITVNGTKRFTEENKSILRFLRDDLHITSAKDGCSEGACGTCTVLFDDKALRACTVTTKMASGHSITTVEGLSDWEKKVYDYAFGKAGAVQCGFCIPGMVICAKGLLDKVADPTEEEIRHAIRNNICRCTGYVKIVEAIRLAGEIFRRGELPEEKAEWKIGARVKRPDVTEKVLGSGIYPDDLYVDGMLHAVALRSKHPRAKVLSIDKTQAEKAEGVIRIFTAEDIPGKKTVGHLVKDWEAMIAVGETTRFLGDPIALIVAETRQEAEKARDLIKVEYEVLPFVSTIDEAKAEGAPLVHPDRSSNLAQERHISRGDAEAAIASSPFTYSATFTTPYTEHAFLEPECALSVPTEDGVRIYSTDQGVFDTQHETAPMLGLPMEKVEVFNCLVGGGFGGKEDVTVQHLSALAAYLLKKPVKMKLSRPESLLFHPKRHPMRETITVGCDENGRILGVKATVEADTGAYQSLCGPVLERACTHASGPYNYQNFKIDGYAYYTDNPPSGAFRGFGVTQTCFGLESSLDRIAEKIGISSWEIRYRNAIRPGEELPNGQIVDESTGLAETLESVKDLYDRSEVKGIACAMKNAGVGVGIPDWGRVRLKIEDGKVKVQCAGSCIGQGLWSVLKQVVSDVSGVDGSRIVVEKANTFAPDSGTTSGSRHTTITGEAARRAALLLKEKTEKRTLEELEGEEFFAEYLGKTDKLGADLPHPVSHVAYGYATQLCILNKDSGKIEKMVAAHSVGKAINPLSLEGQIEGGVVMGMGYALRERYRVKDCRPIDKYGSLGLFRADELPPIESIIVERKGLGVASGAIGVGEITCIPTAPAIANAYRAWDGQERNSLPLENTPYAIKPQEKKELKAHTKRLMVDTSKRCIGCLECVRACSTAFFKVPDPEKACLKIVEKNDWKPVTCIQCGKCATVCPEGAISKNGLGVWTIDRKKCTGCGKCRAVCPMDVMVEASPTLTGKCISCGLCAKACPMDVLYIAEGPKA